MLKQSFGGLIGGMFIVVSGLSALETATNLYIATCKDSSQHRSKSFQAIGSSVVVAPLLAARVFFANVGSNDLTNLQQTYLTSAIFVFILAVVFYFASIPEISDSDMADGEEQGAAYSTGYV